MKITDFLKDAETFYLATVDGDQPHVRPIGFFMEYEGQLAFYTNSHRNVGKQLKANPKLEICAVNKDLQTLRLTGKAKFITSKASQEAAFKEMPALEKMGYKATGEGPFEIYTIEDLAFTLTDVTGQKQEIEL